MAISVIAKISLAVALLYFGAGAFGILVGYALFDILASILLAINLLLIIKTKKSSNLGIVESMRSLFHASTVTWVPALIAAFGTHLGTIIVFNEAMMAERNNL